MVLSIPILKVFLKSYRASKFSILLMFLSLLFAACGLYSVLIINYSAKQSYADQNTYLIPNVSHRITANTSNRPLTKSDFITLRKLGFEQLIPIAQNNTHVAYKNNRLTQRKIQITGIDLISLYPLIKSNTSPKQQNGNTEVLNDAFSNIVFGASNNSAAAFAHPNLIQRFNTQAISYDKYTGTDNLLFSVSNANDKGSNVYLPKLTAVKHPSLGNDIIMDIQTFYDLFPNEPLSSLLFVNRVSRPNQQNLISKLSEVLPSHLTITELNTSDQQGELTESFHLNLMAMALLMFVVCLFITLNAVNLLINARMHWFKICRQIGISRQSIFITQLIETGLFTLIACCLGLYLSVNLVNFVAPSVQATLEGLYNVQVGFGNISLGSLFVQVFLVCIIGSICATIFPYKQVNQLLSSHNYKNLISTKNRTFTVHFLIIAGTFSAIAFSLIKQSNVLWVLLSATAFFILAACCILLACYPITIRYIAAMLPTHLVMLQVSIQQSLALSGKTKIACCAFFIAATSNIGMNLMVDSFRAATQNWLESRLVSDYYLYYNGDNNIQSLAEKAGVTLTQRFENEINYQGLTIQQFSYPNTPEFKQALTFYQIDNPVQAWSEFEREKAVFINQQFSFYYDVQINDVLSLPHPSTKQHLNFVVKGIIHDYGNTYKQVLMPLSMFNSEISKSTIYSITGEPQSTQKFVAALKSKGIITNNQLFTSEQLLTLSMNTFDRTFVITDGLNIITLLIASLSLACAIVVLMNDSKPQNMLIRSLGVSTIKTQLLALFQYSLLCFIALLFATPFGIILSWILIYEINLQAFYWTYPLQIDLAKIVRIYVVSLLVVIVTISLPIFRAGKKPLIEDIRWLN